MTPRTPQEAVNRIAKSFPVKFSKETAEDIVKYLHDIGLGELQTAAFYDTFMDNYEHHNRYFPTLKEVKSIWGGRGFDREYSDYSQYQVRDCIEKTKHYDVARIVQGVNYIRAGGKCGHDDCTETPCITQIMFVRTWGELQNIYAHLVDLDWEKPRMRAYCEKIKNSMIAGDEISFNVDILGKDLNISGNRTGKVQSFDDVVSGMI